MHAVRYSSTLSTFHKERRSIKLILLYNGYPPRYVYSRFSQFIISHLRTSSILPHKYNEHEFHDLRCLLLNRPTIPVYQLASRIAKSIKNNTDEHLENSLVRPKLNKQTKFDNNLIIHYTYEKRLRNNKKAIHQLWKQTFDQTPIKTIQLIIGNQNRPNRTRQLIRCRPQQ